MHRAQWYIDCNVQKLTALTHQSKCIQTKGHAGNFISFKLTHNGHYQFFCDEKKCVQSVFVKVDDSVYVKFSQRLEDVKMNCADSLLQTAYFAL